MNNNDNSPKVNEVHSERTLLALPKINLFYNVLMDRIHMLLSEFFLEHPFTAILNTIPTNYKPKEFEKVERFADHKLVYSGVQKQRAFLDEFGIPIVKEVEDAWLKLELAANISSELTTNNAPISSKIFKEYKNQELDLNDLYGKAMGTLKGYFRSIIEGKESESVIYQKEEFIILTHYLDIDKFYYLSVPLIQFAEFDGMVHIIYHENDRGNFISTVKATDGTNKEVPIKKSLSNLIKSIARTYEELIIDWEIVEGTLHRTELIQRLINSAVDPAFYEYSSTYPLLKELKFNQYYKKHAKYFFDRISLSNRIPIDIREQYRKNAILSILIDSYTHNISAHSLIALETMFRQRATFHDSRIPFGRKSDVPNLPFLREEDFFDYEIHDFIRFLLEKGAFWTGLTRDYGLGGRTNSMFTVLWREFVQNPLYLGTIANTEGITKLNINVTILETYRKSLEGIVWEKKIIADGNLAIIDLNERKISAEDLEEDEIAYQPRRSFVTRGSDFKRLKPLLRKQRAFFPGGVVGKHAFFTILENEIRNVKHYTEAEIEKMRKDGLTLNISIEEGTYDEDGISTLNKSEYLKVGIWLKHPVFVKPQLMIDRLQKINNDIIDSDRGNIPMLGGAFQDKVCAAFLFNNTFTSVEDKSSIRDRRFYPWVKAGFSVPEHQMNESGLVIDYELSARRCFDPEFFATRKAFNENFVARNGYYKKYIHLWRGETIREYSGEDDLDKDWENFARFKFIYTAETFDESYIKNLSSLRKKGILRIITQNVKTAKEAYPIWFKTWLKKNEGQQGNLSLIFTVFDQPVAEVVFDGKRVFYNKGDVIGKEEFWVQKEVPLIHGKNSDLSALAPECRYRNHGVLKQYFCRNLELQEANLTEELAGELLESILTNICIFDNRLVKIFDTLGIEKKNALNISVFSESGDVWGAVRQKTEGFFRFHFLVIHLSFIERFIDPNGVNYTEDTIDQFILDEILNGRQPPENFIIVITSGRGRKQWQYTLEKSNKSEIEFERFVTFRPIESLEGAASNALAKADDIELKYLLVKVLMGS